MTYQQALNAYKASLVRAALLRHGSRRQAAKALGMTPGNLSRLIRRACVLGLPERRDYATRFRPKGES